MPLTQLKLDSDRPCLRGEEVGRVLIDSEQPLTFVNYPSERQLYGCSRDRLVGSNTDSRYLQVEGLNVTEKEL